MGQTRVISPAPQQWARAACILHALFISAVWYATIILDKDIVRVNTWVLLAWLWPIWIVSLPVAGKGQRFRWLVALVVAILILSPTFPTLYSFVVWDIRGFAP